MGICWKKEFKKKILSASEYPGLEGGVSGACPEGRQRAGAKIGHCYGSEFIVLTQADEITIHLHRVPLLHPSFVLLGSKVRLMSRTLSAIFIIIFQK